MPQAALLPAMMGGSMISGALSNRPQSTTRSIDPRYLDIRNTLLNKVDNDLRDPGAGLPGKMKAQAKTRVNRQYQNAASTLSSRMASQGFSAANGTTVRSNLDLNLDRYKSMGDVDQGYDQMILDRDNSNRGLAERLIGVGSGATTTSSGNEMGGAVGGGLSTLTTLMTLDKLMKGGGGGLGMFGK